MSRANPVLVNIGDVVKVEADRGEDAGTVIGKTPVTEFKRTSLTAGYRGRGLNSLHSKEEIRCIIGHVNEYELEQLIKKTEEEVLVLQVQMPS